MSIVQLEHWNQFLQRYPEAHLLQQGQWGQLKAAFGWVPVAVVSGDTGAQVLFRSLPGGFTMGYLPKGPVGPDWDALWPEIDQLCRSKRAVFLKVEPDAWEGEFDRSTELKKAGFQPSPHSLQPPRTVALDIAGEEEDILAAMKQKTRYNIRLSERKEVDVRPSDDLDAFAQLMVVTGERDEFGVHTGDYYRRAYELFHPSGMAELLIASYQGKPLSGLMVFARGSRAWYLYGASNNHERNRMPTYCIQWEAIRWAKAKGCTSYDLWGVPDYTEETLEAQFSERSEGLWGVYRFKRGFGGQVLRAEGAWDKVYMRLPYMGYRWLQKLRGLE